MTMNTNTTTGVYFDLGCDTLSFKNLNFHSSRLQYLCAKRELESDVRASPCIMSQLVVLVHAAEHKVLPKTNALQPAPASLDPLRMKLVFTLVQ